MSARKLAACDTNAVFSFILQWSRGMSAAETAKYTAAFYAKKLLQWSRGMSAAETSFGTVW